MNKLFIIALINAFASIAKAQTTVTFQPDAVISLDSVVDYFSSFVNYGNKHMTSLEKSKTNLIIYRQMNTQSI